MKLSLGNSNNGKGILGGLLFGVVMFFGSFVLLWWNEGNAVKQFHTIGDLDKNTVEASPAQVDPNHEGLPVYLSAEAKTDEELRDTKFDVGKVALRFRRTAEMYQWEEDEKKDSDSDRVSYSYSMVWSASPISSNGFNDQSKKNPATMPFHSENWTAADVDLGSAFKLAKFLIEDLNEFEMVSASGSQPDVAGIKPNGDGFYLGENPSSPVIGDMRISFSAVPPGIVSLIAAQKGNSFERWTSPKTERAIHKIMHGVHTREAVIQRLVTEAKIMLWIFRVVGFVVMFVGLLILTKPLSMVANWIPIIGDFLQSGIALIAFLIAAILSLLTIVVAWIAHRPVVGITLLVVIAGLIFLLVRATSKGKQQRLATPGGTPPPPPPVSGGDTPPPPPPAA